MEITVSKQGYKEKPNKVGQIKYTEKDLNLEEVRDLIVEGHTLSANFNTSSPVFTQKDRRKDNFKSIPFVFYDIDHDCKEDLDYLIDSMEVKPTIAYTTFSHGNNGENRYRLLYFLNKPICNIDIYKYISKEIQSKFPDSIPSLDGCSFNPCQAVFGSRNDCKIVVTNNILDYDFYVQNEESIISGQSNVIKRREGSNIDFNCPVTVRDADFLHDFFHLKHSEVLSKYSSTYNYFDKTPLPEVDKNIPTIALPDNYVEIKRRYYNAPILDENGKTKGYTKRVVKIKDGEGRRKKIFTATLLRKVMMPNVSFPHLLYCGLYDLYYFCYNYDDPIGSRQLYDVVMSAAKQSAHEELIAKSKPKKKSVANPAYCQSNHCSKKKAVGVAKHLEKETKYAEIGNMYDLDSTYEENRATMKEHGLDVSIKDLQRFRIENNLPAPPRKKRMPSTKTAAPIIIAITYDSGGLLINHAEEVIRKHKELHPELWAAPSGYPFCNTRPMTV